MRSSWHYQELTKYEFEDRVDLMPSFFTQGKARGAQGRHFQGIAVDDYGFTLENAGPEHLRLLQRWGQKLEFA